MQVHQRFRPTEPVLESVLYAAITTTGRREQLYLPADACFPSQNIATVAHVWYEPVGLRQTISH